MRTAIPKKVCYWRSFTTELEPILRKSAEKHKARALPAQRKKRGVVLF
jgi:hypothetical protein